MMFVKKNWKISSHTVYSLTTANATPNVTTLKEKLKKNERK